MMQWLSVIRQQGHVPLDTSALPFHLGTQAGQPDLYINLDLIRIVATRKVTMDNNFGGPNFRGRTF